MKAVTEHHARPALRRLPKSARSAAAAKSGGGPNQRLARDRFSRTFAVVLAERYGGSWAVKWKGADRAALPSARDGRAFPGEE